MTSEPVVRLLLAASFLYNLHLAWKRNDRWGMIDACLLGGMMAAIWFIPETQPLLRYGLSGAAMAFVLGRHAKRDFIDGKGDKYSKAMTAGIVVFALTAISAEFMPRPIPGWAKLLVAAVGIFMMATLVWPLLWMGRILFSAKRLAYDLKRQRPPREADEKALGIDLSMLRRPRD